jgi:hypothetical protein
LSFTFPENFYDKEILKKLQKNFVLSYFGEKYEDLSPNKAIAVYTEDYLQAYKELEIDFKKEESTTGNWYSYYEMVSNSIIYNQNEILVTPSILKITQGELMVHILIRIMY